MKTNRTSGLVAGETAAASEEAAAASEEAARHESRVCRRASRPANVNEVRKRKKERDRRTMLAWTSLGISEYNSILYKMGKIIIRIRISVPVLGTLYARLGIRTDFHRFLILICGSYHILNTTYPYPTLMGIFRPISSIPGVRTRISSRRGKHARAYTTQLGSVHLPGDARQTHVRRSRHLPFYDPKVEGRQVTQV
ncbi:hypothetical protein CRG98_008037 [Punica granatum]|uniref:Uncharacterized protein n=1 Tax=Punica granatum TaxID=22663 RepID=A0A2I0KT62_PUNGR|nr:hypothetical protein CRG98_008037 [Punica granatum]